MRDPFDHAVVLMAQHTRDGALGIVINRPLERRPIASLLEAFGADASGIKDSIRVFLGGPVSRDIAFVLHSADYRRPDTVDIDGRVALSDAADVLRDIGLGKGPSKSLVAFGYAGWAASQLEDEIGARRLGRGAGRSGFGLRRRSIAKCGPTRWRCTRPAVESRGAAGWFAPQSLIYSNRFLTPRC